MTIYIVEIDKYGEGYRPDAVFTEEALAEEYLRRSKALHPSYWYYMNVMEENPAPPDSTWYVVKMNKNGERRIDNIDEDEVCSLPVIWFDRWFDNWEWSGGVLRVCVNTDSPERAEETASKVWEEVLARGLWPTNENASYVVDLAAGECRESE
jgi:hypothetical protein